MDNTNKKFSFFIFLYNFLFLLVELAFFGLVLLCGLVFVVSLTLLLIEAFNGDATCVFNFIMSNNCACDNCYKGICDTSCACSCYNDYIELLITLFSISLTGVLLPLTTLIVTLFFSSKTLNENMSKELAKASSIKCYLLKLPLGAWGALCAQKQTEEHAKSRLLLDYKYALHLLFDGEVFQAYNTQIKDVVCSSISNKKKEQKNDKILLWLASGNAVSFVSDISGVSDFKRANGYEINTKSNVNESNITVLVDKENEIKIESHFLKEIFKPKKLIFTIKFSERVERLNKRWQQFTSLTTHFPIFRSIIGSILQRVRKFIHYEFELTVSGIVPTDDRYSQYRFNILDVKICQVRKYYKKDKNKKSIKKLR